MKSDKKPWFSKTLVFAVLFGILQIAGLFGYLDYTPTSDVSEIVGIVVSIVVFVLRMVTNKGIAFGRPRGTFPVSK